MNHILILSGNHVYCFGDKTIGALGNEFKSNDSISRVDMHNLTSIALRGVKKIFTTYYSSFVITEVNSKKKGVIRKVYGFGLNNYGQLGLKTDQTFQLLPKEWKTFDGNKIKEITGGEHHSLFLLNDGSIIGAGRNDDGQLGEIEPMEIGTLQKVTHISNVDRIYSAAHYNYCYEAANSQYYAWGFGGDYVLGNGQENSLFRARPVNKEKVFVHAPLLLSLGSNHVAYVSDLIAEMEKNIFKQKKKIVNIEDLFEENHKKVE